MLADMTERFDAKEWAMGHERLCAERYGGINSRLELLTKMTGWGGAAIAAAVIGFAAYEYTTNQTLEQHQIEAQSAALQAVHQTAIETVKQLKAAQ